jgi:D-3-phosphoglycerate dehydrogenase
MAGRPTSGARERPIDLPQRHDPDVLIVRSTKVLRPVFEKGQRLSLVVRAGAGYDNIDLAAASELAVFVANCPGKNALAVAELTFALLLACDRRVPDATADLRAGVWKKKEYSKARGLAGRTLGVVGIGNIGLAVIQRAKAFGMRVVAWSRSLTPDRAAELGIQYAETPLMVARAADAVTLHFAATPETKGMIGAEFFDAMKKGAYFINTTRGSTVDHAALKKAIAEKGIRAGLDVFDQEPATDGAFANDIVNLPGVYGTHHVGASTDQAQEAVADETVRIVLHYQTLGEVSNCVNLCASSPAKALLVVRHRNRPGVLASVFEAISKSGVNVEEMENIIYDGAGSACARIKLGSPLPKESVKALRSSNENIFSVSMSDV